MTDARLRVFDALETLGIGYELHEHPPVFTGEEAARSWERIRGARVKNLFLRNKKGDRHYLVILEVAKEAHLRRLAKVIGDDRLSFASPERLMRYLGVQPGSVSPFGLIHDTDRAVMVIVDEELRAAERLIFHPNDNTASVAIATADFERFLAGRGNAVRWLRL